MTTLYSIVVPVYNTAQSVVELVERVNRVFSDSIKEEFEIILVDDCSPRKETWPSLVALADKYEFVRVIQLMRNFGQQSATMCGFEYSRGKFIITMDDDLQHRPEDIPLLVENKEHDIVVAQMMNKKHSVFKKITSRIKGWFDRILIGKPRNVQLSSFRLINRSVIAGMLKIRTSNPFIPALMFYVSKDVIGVNVEHDVRKEGSSNYTFRRMVRLFSNLIINNSSFLLRALGLFGIVISSLSFAFGIFFMIRKAVADIAPLGWTSVMVAVLFFGGILLFAIGIIGEYLIRIISGTEQKPTYVVRQTRNA